ARGDRRVAVDENQRSANIRSARDLRGPEHDHHIAGAPLNDGVPRDHDDVAALLIRLERVVAADADDVAMAHTASLIVHNALRFTGDLGRWLITPRLGCARSSRGKGHADQHARTEHEWQTHHE